jgi:hypothetical protein
MGQQRGAQQHDAQRAGADPLQAALTGAEILFTEFRHAWSLLKLSGKSGRSSALGLLLAVGTFDAIANRVWRRDVADDAFIIFEND